MTRIQEIKNAVYNNIELSNDQIIHVFREFGADGNIIIYKNDGLRLDNKVTVVISSPTEKFNSIRYDDVTLGFALAKCLRKYFDGLSGK